MTSARLNGPIRTRGPVLEDEVHLLQVPERVGQRLLKCDVPGGAEVGLVAVVDQEELPDDHPGAGGGLVDVGAGGTALPHSPDVVPDVQGQEVGQAIVAHVGQQVWSQSKENIQK